MNHKLSIPFFGLLMIAAAFAVGQTMEDLRLPVTIGLIYLTVVVGMHAFIGMTGIMSFGHVGFMAIGAYTSAILSMSPNRKMIFLANLPEVLKDITLPSYAAALVGGCAALAVAAFTGRTFMRLSKLNVSIATLLVLMIIQSVLRNSDGVTGASGLLPGVVRSVTLGTSAITAVLAILAVWAFQTSRVGFKIRSARQDPLAAAAIGLDVEKGQRIAYYFSAFIVGIGGAQYAHFVGSLSPNFFYFSTTGILLGMLVIGGIGTLSGAIVGTFLVTAILELLRRIEPGLDLGLVHLPSVAGLREFGLSFLFLLILIRWPRGLMNGSEVNIKQRGVLEKEAEPKHA
ncbi:branched-chain amino acid ABC transporter permease [Agrobacterium pusense]|uniref:branched-chain amino acid ABC transporter permease n=1 Tax=Agrobacterium pusense TaxID=648995 RepID=UPI0035A5DC89